MKRLLEKIVKLRTSHSTSIDMQTLADINMVIISQDNITDFTVILTIAQTHGIIKLSTSQRNKLLQTITVVRELIQYLAKVHTTWQSINYQQELICDDLLELTIFLLPNELELLIEANRELAAIANILVHLPSLGLENYTLANVEAALSYKCENFNKARMEKPSEPIRQVLAAIRQQELDNKYQAYIATLLKICYELESYLTQQLYQKTQNYINKHGSGCSKNQNGVWENLINHYIIYNGPQTEIQYDKLENNELEMLEFVNDQPHELPLPYEQINNTAIKNDLIKLKISKFLLGILTEDKFTPYEKYTCFKQEFLRNEKALQNSDSLVEQLLQTIGKIFTFGYLDLDKSKYFSRYIHQFFNHHKELSAKDDDSITIRVARISA